MQRKAARRWRRRSGRGGGGRSCHRVRTYHPDVEVQNMSHELAQTTPRATRPAPAHPHGSSAHPSQAVRGGCDGAADGRSTGVAVRLHAIACRFFVILLPAPLSTPSPFCLSVTSEPHDWRAAQKPRSKPTSRSKGAAIRSPHPLAANALQHQQCNADRWRGKRRRSGNRSGRHRSRIERRDGRTDDRTASVNAERRAGMRTAVNRGWWCRHRSMLLHERYRVTRRLHAMAMASKAEGRLARSPCPTRRPS